MILASACFRYSPHMLSSPGAFPCFKFLIDCLTSLDMGLSSSLMHIFHVVFWHTGSISWRPCSIMIVNLISDTWAVIWNISKVSFPFSDFDIRQSFFFFFFFFVCLAILTESQNFPLFCLLLKRSWWTERLYLHFFSATVDLYCDLFFKINVFVLIVISFLKSK